MHALLYAQQDAYQRKDWLGDMVKQIASRFNQDNTHNPLFPCLFARKAFVSNRVQFLPIPYIPNEGYDLERFAHALRQYLQSTLSWDGKFNTAYPLLTIFEPQPNNDIDAYTKLFLQSLQYLMDNDEKPWVGNIPRDPNQEYWTMCFHGVQLFINVSHPNHHLRKSRNLCDTLVFVINPRERFDIFAGDNPAGYAIREQIRKNIDNYDHIPRSPLLGHYLLGELEWPQYMLPQTNQEPPLSCPLSFSANQGNDKQSPKE